MPKKKNSAKRVQKKVKKEKKFFKELAKKFSKISTMKKWGYLSWGTAIILTLILIIGVFFTEKPMDAYVTIVALAWGEVATYSIVYAWKEKAQNKLKITYGFLEKLADKYRIENISHILQSIIRD